MTVLAIALVLAGSPISPLFCRAWCDTIGVPVTGETCHHEPASDIALVAGDDCATPALDTMAFVREDTERFASSSGAYDDGVLVSGHHLQSLTDIGHVIVDRSLERSFGREPLSLTLRI